MEKRTILFDGTLFDSKRGEMKANQTVVIVNKSIVWVDETGKFSKNSDDFIINCEDKYLLPGLIDCHVHLEAEATFNYDQQMMRTPTSMYHYIALKSAVEHLNAGFTTLRDCGSWNANWGQSLREAFATGMFKGPRLLIATQTIGQWGNQSFYGPDFLDQEEKKQEVLTGIDGVMHAVRDRKRAGADFIKTMTTGGVLHGQESQLDRSLWREEELEAMVDEANRLGMHVAVHAHGLHGIIKAAKAKVQTIEHGSFIDDEAARIMRQNNVFLVPTQTSAFMDKPDLMKELPEEVQRKTIEVDSAMFQNHKIAFENDVKIALGTDAGVPGNPHGTSAKELTEYVEKIEMTPLQALQSATLHAAEAIKLDHKIGSVEIDKLADIIILESDPSENIGILEEKANIKYILKEGKILKER
jgi:imidazolonepropionase-like amidohydrolase